MFLWCEICDVQCRNIYHWSSHLISNDHQKLSNVNIHFSSSEMKDRTIVGWCPVVCRWPITDERFVKYFSDFGLVHDIYFKRSAHTGHIQAFIVLLDSISMVNKVLTYWKLTPKIDTISVVLKERECVSTREWNKWIGDPKLSLFAAKHKSLIENLRDESLDKQLSIFLKKVTLDEKQTILRYRVLRDISTEIQKNFPNCALKPFGSFLSGISSEDGDIDVFVDVNGSMTENQSIARIDAEELDTLLRIITKSLRKSGYPEWSSSSSNPRRKFIALFSSVIPVFATRVPIIRLIHGKTEIQVDLSFNSQLSIQNSRLAKFFIEYDSRVLPLIMLIRYWGGFHHLTGSNKIKNYALILMVFVFLNHKQIIPSVHFLQNSCGAAPLIIDGWNGGFNYNVEYVRSLVSTTDVGAQCANYSTTEPADGITILELAEQFFDMVGSMDLANSMLSPYLGRVIKKAKFYEKDPDLLSDLPWEKIKDLRLNQMCIQDPFVLNFNVSGNVREVIMKEFQSTSRSTSILLKRMLTPRAGTVELKINLMDLFCAPSDTGLPDYPTDRPSSRHEQNLSETRFIKRDQEALIISKSFVLQPQILEGAKTVKNTELQLDKSHATPTEDSEKPVVTLPQLPREVSPPLHSGEKQKHEVNLIVQMDDLFIKTYMSLVDGLNIVPESKLITIMTNLWITIINDFPDNLFAKSFHMVFIKTAAKPSVPTPVLMDEYILRKRHSQETTDSKSSTMDLCSSPPVTNPFKNTVNGTELRNDDVTNGDASYHHKEDISDSAVSNETLKRKFSGSATVSENTGMNQGLKTRRYDDFMMPVGSDFFIDSRSNASQLRSDSPENIEKNEEMRQAILMKKREIFDSIPSGTRKSFAAIYEVNVDARYFFDRKNMSMERAQRREKYKTMMTSGKFSKLIKTDHPIEIEDKLTRALFTRNRIAAVHERCVRFECKFSVDTSGPLAFVEFKQEMDNSDSTIPPIIDLIEQAFADIFLEYSLFRLIKQFE